MEVLDVLDQQRICDFYQSILTGLVEVGMSVGASVGMSVGVLSTLLSLLQALLCKAMYPPEDAWRDLTEGLHLGGGRVRVGVRM